MQPFPRQVTHASWRLVLSLLVMLGLAATPGFGFVTGAAQSSPAGDHAQVIAQGIAELPAAEVSWQALAFSAGPLDTTNPINADGQSLQSPGFLLATTGPFLTVSPDGDLLHRLNPGEAAFTPGNARLNPLSESTDLVRFVAVTLAATSGPKSATGIPFYTGETFTVEPGVHDFDLVRGLLDPGQSTRLTSGEIPALFLALEGELQLVTPNGDSAVVAAEQAVTYAGEITITNVGSARAVFVSAIIGEEIALVTGDASANATRRISMQPASRPPAPAPAPRADRGTITLRAYTCPPRAADGSFNPSACTPLTTGFEAQLTKVVDGSVLRLNQAVRDGNAFRWEGLTVNPDNAQNLMVYIPSQPVTPAGYVDFVITGDISNVGNIALMVSKPQAEIAIYNFAAAPAYGSYMIDISMCPVPVNPAAPNLSECGAYDPPGGGAAALNMSLSGGSTIYYPDHSQANIVTWENLPPGAYTLNQNSSSAGVHSARIGGQTLVCCQAGALTVNVDTRQGDVSQTLFLYFELDGPDIGQPLATVDGDGDGLDDELEARIGTNPWAADSDGDGLTDAEEYNSVTSPMAADSDLDGLDDLDELQQGTDPLNPADPGDPGDLDADGDGLTDAEEASLGTNALSSDTDGDGRSDFDETRSLRPSNPGVTDTDGDGLSDGDEANVLGSDPTYADPDNDGFSDAEEVAAGTDPFDPLSNPSGSAAASVDSDFDGISDEREAQLGTDPFSADTDGDGMEDGTEEHLGFDPLFPDQ